MYKMHVHTPNKHINTKYALLFTLPFSHNTINICLHITCAPLPSNSSSIAITTCTTTTVITSTTAAIASTTSTGRGNIHPQNYGAHHSSGVACSCINQLNVQHSIGRILCRSVDIVLTQASSCAWVLIVWREGVDGITQSIIDKQLAHVNNTATDV